jgi:spectinomycin phosphotransferase
MLIGEDPVIAEEYAARTGVVVEPVVVQLYRLWWDLCEIALYITEFRAPHIDSEDTRVAWRGLREHLDPTRWKS